MKTKIKDVSNVIEVTDIYLRLIGMRKDLIQSYRLSGVTLKFDKDVDKIITLSFDEKALLFLIELIEKSKNEVRICSIHFTRIGTDTLIVYKFNKDGKLDTYVDEEHTIYYEYFNNGRLKNITTEYKKENLTSYISFDYETNTCNVRLARMTDFGKMYIGKTVSFKIDHEPSPIKHVTNFDNNLLEPISFINFDVINSYEDEE